MRKISLFLTVLMLVSSVAFAQNIQVKGTVTDASTGEPVSFASVMVKGTMTGAATDMDGMYTMTVPADAVLVFSFVGYHTQEVAVGGKSVVNCALAADVQYLDDVIVVAFGTTTKESFTGSAAVVNSEKLEKSQVSSVTNALAGAVAGVQLTSSNGAPGSTSTIRVRGFSSISAGQSPLIIVDGAPYGGDIGNINQADVESMTVLKDAASNALYGARGANGVIIITTKSAKKGNAVVSFDARYGVNSKALQEYNVVTDPRMYFEMQYDALNNYNLYSLGLTPEQSYMRINQNIYGDEANGGLGYDIWTLPANQQLFGINGKMNPAATLGKLVKYGENDEYWVVPDDWKALGYRKGVRQEYNMSVSGSSDKSTFYASMAYLDNQGITTGSDMTRLTARLRADYQAKDWLKVGGNFSYSKFNYNQLDNNGNSTSTGNIWAFTSQMAPIYPAYIRNADGSIRIDSNGYEMMDYGSGLNAGFHRPFIGDANPMMDNKLNTYNSEGNSLSASGFMDIDILKGLKLTINATTFIDETRSTFVYNGFYGQFDSTGGTVSKEHDRKIDYNLQQLLNYNLSLGDNHITALLGHEYYNAKSYGVWGSKSKMFSPDNKELNGAIIDGQGAGSSVSEYNNEGYFFRGQYDFDNRIFVSGSFRRDASSRFDPDYRWGNFWSAGAAWVISEENWFNVPAINELKFKSSIGSQGNDNLNSSYRYTDLYDIINSDGSIATSFRSKGSKTITWETNTNFNAGAEFTFFDRVSGSFEYFFRNTTDMLFSFSVAPSMGYSSYYANVGDMYNKGAELELNVNVANKKNFQWDVNFNATYLQNKITMLDPDKKVTKAWDAEGNEYNGYVSGSSFIAEGLPLYTWYIKEFAGIDPQTGESLWYKDVMDSEGDDRTGERVTTNKYSEASYYITNKSTIAPIYGGFGTSINFYNFDFSINCSYQLGGYQYDSTYANFMSSPTGNDVGTNFHVDLLNSWTKENPSTTIPRFQFEDTYSAGTSTRFLTKGNYLNIENMNFGYTLPSKWTREIGVQSLRLYVSAENVWYWSKRQGFDPRQSYDTSSNATNYSPMRTISGGVSLKF